MINNTQTLKQQIDLRTLVERDLGQPAIRSGRAHLYKCPFHNEQKGFSLAVWSDGYRCFGKCDTSGDVFDWLMQFRQLSFTDARSVLDSGHTSIVTTPIQCQPITTEPPDTEWQTKARNVIELAEEILWSSEGEPALTYLLNRGLTSNTIRQARLGYTPGNYSQWKDLYGLKVPCGITIPWFANDALWAVKVRRSAGEQRYVQITGGSSHGLYNADALSNNHIPVFCEGEFDTLILEQEARQLISPVTLGSATNRLSVRWLQKLVSHEQILVAYDNDIAGRRGTERLLKTSPRFMKLCLPNGKDINHFYVDGGDVYGWISNCIQGQRDHA